MLRFRFVLLTIGIFTLGALLPTTAEAGNLVTWLRKCVENKPPYAHVPTVGVSVGTPSPERYTGGRPCRQWYGYGWGVPTYNWGYFGARYQPVCICHKGYYGDFVQWSYRRGY